MSIGTINIKDLFDRVKTYVLDKIDPALLLFILLMCNYRFSFKIAALIGIYFYRPVFKFKMNGITLFYSLMIVLGILNALFINRDYSSSHLMVVLTGCLIWLACLLSFNQLDHAININEPFKLINTLKVFACLNFLISLVDIVKVMLIKSTINPYTQIASPPYGISSGDHVGGVFGQIHLVNTVICCLLTVFFIYHRLFWYAVICLIPFLLTGSNLATIVLVTLLLYILMFHKDKLTKYYALTCICICIIFYAKITPPNQYYMVSTLKKAGKQIGHKIAGTQPVYEPAAAERPLYQPEPDTVSSDINQKQELTKQELIFYFLSYKHKSLHDTSSVKKKKEHDSVFTSLKKLESEVKSIKAIQTDKAWYRKDSVKQNKMRSEFYEYGNLKKFDLNRESGKITSFKQTKNFMEADWKNMVFGAGIGSYSSRLAFITSGIVDDSRILMALPKYETHDFKENHEAIFKYLMYLDDATHSVTNLPFSWYNEMFGEYGLLGFVIFASCYLFFFIKRFPLFSYGKILFLAMIVFFLFDYWYERLSVMLIFEYLLLLDIKIRKPKSEIAT